MLLFNITVKVPSGSTWNFWNPDLFLALLTFYHLLCSCIGKYCHGGWHTFYKSAYLQCSKSYYCIWAQINCATPCTVTSHTSNILSFKGQCCPRSFAHLRLKTTAFPSSSLSLPPLPPQKKRPNNNNKHYLAISYYLTSNYFSYYL